MKATRNARTIGDLDLLTPKDVATILVCSTKSLGRYCRQGLFPKPFYIGKFPRWRKSVVDDFLSRNQPPLPEN
jgi:predicted DNA-binding transcriptional regulator AlpA